jgi:hypothetical protein
MYSGPPEQSGCAAVNSLLAAFVRGTLSPEQRGRVDGHLETCDACAEALGQRIAESIATGEIPQPAKVRREALPLPKVLTRSFVPWHRHRISIPILREKGYYTVIQSARLYRGVAMSGSAGDAAEIQLLDSTLDVVVGETIRASVIEPPYFTKEGEFRMTLWLEEADVVRYRGYSAICVLKLEDIWLAFESLVASQEIPFRAGELPPLEAEALLRSDAFGYFLSRAPLSTAAV